MILHRFFGAHQEMFGVTALLEGTIETFDVPMLGMPFVNWHTGCRP